MYIWREDGVNMEVLRGRENEERDRDQTLEMLE